PRRSNKLAIKLIRAIEAAEQDLEKEDRKAKAKVAKDALESIHVSYDEGARHITGQLQKPGRAKEYFEEFLLRKYRTKAQANTALGLYEKSGFTGMEVVHLGKEFAALWPTRNKKGKQGNVKDPDKDARKKPKLAPLPPQLRERLGRSDNES